MTTSQYPQDLAARAMQLAKSAATAAAEAHSEAKSATRMATLASDVAKGNRAAINEVSESLGGIAGSLAKIADRLSDLSAAQTAMLELFHTNMMTRP